MNWIRADGDGVVLTLHIQRGSKRATFDVTQHYWRVAMLSELAACALWLA